MSRIETPWIEVFIAVYRERNVSRAAERLGIAQASASVALARLRTHFGDRLFVRTARGMEPTPRAQALYPELVAVTERLEALRTQGTEFDPAHAARRFRIAMTDISEVVLLPGLLAYLRRTAPGVQITAEPSSPDSARRLEAGEVDLAVGFMPQLETGFHQQTLFVQNFVCLAAAEHPRIRGALSRRSLVDEWHVVVAAAGTGHAIVDRVLARHRVERRVALEVPSFLGVARIVARTDLLAIVPHVLGEILSAQEPVQLLELPMPFPGYGVKQHWHARLHDDTGHAWLRRTIVQLFDESSVARPRPAVRRTNQRSAPLAPR